MSALAGLAIGATAIALALQGGSDDLAREAESVAAGPTAALGPTELAGQRLIAGWDGAEPPRGLRRMVREGHVAGVILFDDNVSAAARTRTMLAGLQELAAEAGPRGPLLVMVDQEGGQVQRIAGPPNASAAEIGERGAGYARLQGQETARLLRDYGINVDLAPVLDIGGAGGAIDRERRAFGSDPESVIEVGIAGFTEGLRSGGVAATAKHFPGIGEIRTNTDFASQRVRTPLERLREREMRPFEAFIETGGELIMLSLAIYPDMADRPAGFSRAVVTSELRDRLGFEGVTVTDGLGAAAAQSFGSEGRIALAAVEAGNDLLLYTDWRRARDAGRLLTRRLREGALEEAPFRESVERVLRLRTSLDD
jgi:beta-N-acetylhexosaminidase